jgi:hypothetical protein
MLVRLEVLCLSDRTTPVQEQVEHTIVSVGAGCTELHDLCDLHFLLFFLYSLLTGPVIKFNMLLCHIDLLIKSTGMTLLEIIKNHSSQRSLSRKSAGYIYS